MKTIFILVSVMVVLFIAAPNKVEAQKVKSSGIGKFQAVVGKDEATFIFPIKTQKRYEWYGGGLQYAWQVKIKNKNRNYEVGYSLFTSMGATPTESGNFQDLLNNGQFDAWSIAGKTGSVMEVSVKGFANDKQDKLTIKLTGSKAVQLLFSGKPQSIVFYTKILNKTTSVKIPVTYSGK
jgi:hypothetical protein